MRYATLVFSISVLLSLVACRGGPHEPPNDKYDSYLPPCTPMEGASSSDPCESDSTLTESGGEVSFDLSGTPGGPGEYLFSGAHAAHLVVRSTYIPRTARCVPDEHDVRRPPYMDEFYWNHAFGRTKEIKCYADVRVNDYILGSGPTTLTIMHRAGFYFSYESPQSQEAIRLKHETWFSKFVDRGQEVILFIGPSIDMQAETWRRMTSWHLERRGSTVVAVHPLKFEWEDGRPDVARTHRSKLEMSLPDFKTAIRAAHQARLTANSGRIGSDTDLPMLVTNANQLSTYFTALDAYNHPEGPPVPPPPPCGLIVADQVDNAGLMHDCMALLAAKDTLRGTGALNWDTGTTMSSWDGVTTGGTPTRVTKVLLSNESLTGTIPAELAELSELTHLNLSSNTLTGEIPLVLGRLDELVEVRLTGNSLTGCIPHGLKDVTTNDLSTLNLLYCPPAPATIRGGIAAETSLPLRWTAVANAAKYRVEYRNPYMVKPAWTVHDDTITTTSHTVDGLLCEKDYELRVSAYGDGTALAASWGETSQVLKRIIGSCTPPTFGAESYSFTVPDDAPKGTAVGTITATDASLPVEFDIIWSDAYYPYQRHLFILDEDTGVFYVDQDLSDETGLSLTLRIRVWDAVGGEATAEVTIAVTERTGG